MRTAPENGREGHTEGKGLPKKQSLPPWPHGMLVRVRLLLLHDVDGVTRRVTQR